MIHQHFKLVDVLTAAENIILGLNDHKLIDLKNVRTQYGPYVTAMVSLWIRIKKFMICLSRKSNLRNHKGFIPGADVLILDEPTAVLTPRKLKTF
jgi:simple sugar transport system ATP-binding protein